MKVQAQRLAVALLIYVVGVVCVAGTSYWLEKQRFMADIDARLLAAASNVPFILPADFHDVARTPQAISEEQDKKNLELMSLHARSGDLTYLYSYVMHEGKIRFTSCNYTKEDIKKDQVVTYWTSYPEGSQAYIDAMTSSEPVYVTAGDRWGLFRTILLPLTSPGGQPYVAAADMDITVIQQSLMRSILSFIGISLLLLLIAVPLVVAYRRTHAEMNKELLVLNKQLQSDIDQAMALESELKDATLKANTANNIKSQFLANMSHELRTPINGVIGMNQLLLDTHLSDEQREYANLSSQSANVLLDTINQILDLATIEEGRLITKPETLDTTPFFSGLVQMFSSQIADKHLELVLTLDPALPSKIQVDPVRLRQVLSNLIANAIKFTFNGSIQVSLYWKNGVLSGDVTDTGIGIPEESQQRVFETFQQVDNSSSRSYGGTGLGLPISQQICHAMGGDLLLKKSDNSGSTFAFYIDAPTGSDTQIKRLTLPADSRVVVVTQTPVLWDWLKSELTPTVAQCQQATTAEEAIVLMKDANLLLVDVSIGTSALNTLSYAINPDHQRLVCLAWSGQRLPEVLTSKIQVIHKPLSTDRLSSLYKSEITISPSTSPNLSGRVLIVDDNPSNLKAMGDQLKSTGLKIDLVNNGADAIIACQQHNYDLILMDIQMPNMDGLETTRRINRMHKKQAPPIVGVSAHVMEENISSAKQAGMTSYLCKPITKDTLLNKVAEFLQ